MVKLNTVKDRKIYLSPTVQAGWEDESCIQDFTILKTLGRGAFGKVAKACHKKSRLIYAIKEINKMNLMQNNLIDQVGIEVKIMYSLTSHDNILKLYNHFEDDISIYLILEFAAGGQLYQNLFKQPQKRYNEKKASRYAFHLIKALKEIHTKGIIHRDIKPENLLLDDADKLKLADFGWSTFLKPDGKSQRETFCGTLDYLAPEMLDQGHKHDFHVDIWSVGVLIFELLTGTSPFSPKDQQYNQNYVDQFTRNSIKNVQFKFSQDFPPIAKDLVSKILVKDPNARISIQEMIEHQWITSHNDVKSDIKDKQIFNKSIIETVKDKYNQFSKDEIQQFTREDSIINKDFAQQYAQKPNFYDQKSTQQSSSSQNQMPKSEKDKFVMILTERNKQIYIQENQKHNQKITKDNYSQRIKKLSKIKLRVMIIIKLRYEKKSVTI